MKNLTKCNIVSTFALKNYGKDSYHKIRKNVLSVLSWPWPRLFLSLATRGLFSKHRSLALFFFESLASNVVSLTPPLILVLGICKDSSTLYSCTPLHLIAMNACLKAKLAVLRCKELLWKIINQVLDTKESKHISSEPVSFRIIMRL